MKVVVTSTGESLDSEIDPRFGRAAFFVLIDTETGEHRAVSNEVGREAGHGAGIQSAETVSGLGANMVLTGECGPKAEEALKRAGIPVRTKIQGCVADAVNALKTEISVGR
ncbi:MAG TPA: NifB/NifX family molybdenum-iron cluster-binding protein [Elusimicrobiota bacterium]|nr:NifB/NifX family molybdenum-iron cluster-binding protein [Elusimicrobiota bacterium]